MKSISLNDYKKYDKTLDTDEEKSIYTIDDNVIGFLVNTYAIINGMDCLTLWKSFSKPGEGEIPKEPYKYIAIPYRIYNGDRELEFKLAPLLHKTIMSSKVYDDIDSITKDQKIYMINFKKNIKTILPQKQALGFICLASELPLKINKNVKW